jgi:hypothetical protein
MNNRLHPKSVVLEQLVPLSLTILTAAGLCGVLWLEVAVLNTVAQARIVPTLRIGDILLGLTIYLKTSVDFAIFIARLMEGNPGWRSRVAIEIGTAVGNAAGTIAVLAVWAFFKEVKLLLALMILLAALVLFKLAEDGLEHAKTTDKKYPDWFRRRVDWLEWVLDHINKAIAPVLRYVIPKFNMGGKQGLRFWSLLGFSFTVPFILGLDDFAGYVPVFNVVNVFGFSVGVVIGHMLLNVLLYLSPAVTIRVVKNPIISVVGSLAFIGLAIWGIVEVLHLLM